MDQATDKYLEQVNITLKHHNEALFGGEQEKGVVHSVRDHEQVLNGPGGVTSRIKKLEDNKIFLLGALAVVQVFGMVALKVFEAFFGK